MPLKATLGAKIDILNTWPYELVFSLLNHNFILFAALIWPPVSAISPERENFSSKGNSLGECEVGLSRLGPQQDRGGLKLMQRHLTRHHYLPKEKLH